MWDYAKAFQSSTSGEATEDFIIEAYNGEALSVHIHIKIKVLSGCYMYVCQLNTGPLEVLIIKDAIAI